MGFVRHTTCVHLCALLTVFAQTAHATPGQDTQTNAASQTLEQLLARLATEAAALDRSLPSFGCTETAISREVQPDRKHHTDKVLRRVDFTAVLRVRRAADGKLDESTEYLTVNGKPFSGGFSMPAYAEGGFRQSLGYFAADQQPCYRYTLSPGRLDFEAAPRSALHPDCRSLGTRGFALLDAAGNVTHVERRVSAAASMAWRLVPFAAIDLAPITLNGETYQLSYHLLSERPNGHSIDRFEADYANCKLFTATVTLGPVTEPAAPRR